MVQLHMKRIFFVSLISAYFWETFSWISNMSVSYKDEYLNVSFMPTSLKVNHTQYNICIWEADDGICNETLKQPVEQIKVFKFWPVTVVSKRIKLEANDYCLSISSDGDCLETCAECTITFSVLSHYHVFKNIDKINCSLWDVYFEGKELNHGLHFFFEIHSKYVSCFKTFLVGLWKDVYSKCNAKNGVLIETRSVSINELSVLFNNLIPGNYCIRMIPSNYNYPAYSNIYEVKTLKPVILESESLTEDALEDIWIIIISLSCVVLIFAGLACYAFRKHFMLISLGKTSCQTEINRKSDKKINVFILYFRESVEHETAVKAFADFLRECCNVEVILDIEHTSEIYIDKESWMDHVLHYKCNSFELDDEKESVDRKIIIIESEGAVMQQQKRRKRQMHIQYCEDENYMSNIFDYGFSQLLSRNPEQHLKDHCHIFVIHFSYTSRDYKLENIVPNRRYYVPDNLIELYNALHEISLCGLVFLEETEKIKRYWYKHYSYQKLLELLP